MTAALTVVPDLGDDLGEIEQLEGTVQVGLAAAVDALARLRELQAHTARGHALWHEYVVDRFGHLLRYLRLPDGERLALVGSMCTPAVGRPRGLPVREQAAVLGVAVGTVQNDRRALGLAPAPRPRKPAPVPLPAPTGKRWEQATEHLRRAADRGLTLVELAAVMGISEGSASGLLTYVVRKRVAIRTEQRRADQRVHLVTEAGRALLTDRP